MKKDAGKKPNVAPLRRRAEDLLKGNKPETGPTPHETDLKRLIHELQVHQIELEMQNEELNRAREEAEEVLAKYTDLYDFAPVGYLTFDEKGLISELNLTAARLLGVERSFLVNKPFSTFIQRELQDRFYLYLQGVLESPAKQTCDLVLKRKDGVSFDVQLESIAAKVDGHKIVRAALTDITAQKRTDDAVRESEEWLMQFFDSIPDYCYLASPEGRLVNVNHAVLEALGYSREELIGQPMEMIYAAKSQQKQARLFDRWLKTGTVLNEELTIGTKDGGERTVLLSVGSMKDKEGKVMHSTSVQTDITERKRAEGERAKLENQLRRTQKLEAIGTLAGGIAHDFNNILAGILGFTEMALEDTSPDNPVYQELKLVLKGAHRGRDLVKQIMAFSRLNEQEQKTVILSNVVDEALKLLRPAFPATISIKKRLIGAHDTILADPVQMDQVVMNLCTNAAHAMRGKGGTLEVSIVNVDSSDEELSLYAGLRPGAYVRLSVADTGSGMTPEVLEEIFDPFFTTKGPGEGTGLGLSVVHGIVKDHGGHIAVSSELGKGSTFHVYLPTVEAVLSAEAVPQPAIQGGKERILFVDDEEMLVELNYRRLSALGYQVVTSTSSVDALTLFEAEPGRFDLVITDYTMPTMTGIDLARALLATKPDTPVILASGLNGKILPERIEEAGIRAFLSKTAGKRELAELIRRVLDTKT